MSKGNLHRLISPKSIAVVGNRGANFAIRESLKLGYSHQIWAVHPYLESLEGIKCFKDIKDLPEVPDATFIAVNAESAIEVVSDLKSMGGGGAVDSAHRHFRARPPTATCPTGTPPACTP